MTGKGGMTGKSRVRRAPGTVTEILGDQAVVWSGRAGTLHHLDSASTLVWLCLAEPAPPEEIADRVDALVADGPPTLRADVRSLLDTLAERSLVVPERRRRTAAR
jgi:coenzyme PQQ synthesis protein D (PqqD)